LSKPPRTPGGWCRYGDEHVKRLLFIQHALDLGFENDDIRGLLDFAGHPERPCASADTIAQRHCATVNAKISALKALRKEIGRERVALPRAA
jgi:DNA-binding transcriptional MerR regulator